MINLNLCSGSQTDIIFCWPWSSTVSARCTPFSFGAESSCRTDFAGLRRFRVGLRGGCDVSYPRARPEVPQAPGGFFIDAADRKAGTSHNAAHVERFFLIDSGSRAGRLLAQTEERCFL